MEIPKSFLGYKRENGRAGTRNHVIILPVDDISNACAEAVANNIKGTIALPHSYGRLQFGADLELHFRTMIGTAKNPNVAAAIIIGIIIYQSYGKKHAGNKLITPWETFRLTFTNPDRVEHRRRWAAFHAADTGRNNHLNLSEFIAAMQSLGFPGESEDALREYFHSADDDQDGILDIDLFLLGVEELEFD